MVVSVIEAVATSAVREAVASSTKMLIPMANVSDGGMVVACGAIEWATAIHGEHGMEAFAVDDGAREVEIDPTDEGLMHYATQEVEAMWQLLAECEAAGCAVFLLGCVPLDGWYGGLKEMVVTEVVRDMRLMDGTGTVDMGDVRAWVRDVVGAAMADSDGAWRRAHVRCERGSECTATGVESRPVAGVDTRAFPELALRLPVLRLVECEPGAANSMEVYAPREGAVSPVHVCDAVTGDQGAGHGGVCCALDHGRKGRGLLQEWMRRERGCAHMASQPISSVRFPVTATLAPCVLSQWRDDLYSENPGVVSTMVRQLGEATQALSAANVAVYVCALAPRTGATPRAAILASVASQTALPAAALEGAPEFANAVDDLRDTISSRVGHTPTPLEAAVIVASIAAGDAAPAGERSALASMLGAHTARLTAAHRGMPLAAHAGLFPGAPEILP
jgi:hypothetical protein